ncbi:ABC transporter substrate-binding protein [Desulfotignum balticum]|uniref:ABC transporter substrate-binding protein n=1 Tax=Desulfotignum balticum TaxID=115781 RepID=UPI0004146252|nr:ABC transporter substrate-binding protein [Desulfotignum balticum]
MVASNFQKKAFFWGKLIFLSALVMLLVHNSAVAKETIIKIGVVGPLTGQFAAVGQSQLNGAEMKANEINAAPGEYTIELISEDDASKCDQSVNATVKLITRERAVSIIGACNSPCALAMVPITQRYQVPQFTFGVGTAITKQGSDWIFRVAVGAPGQTQALADYAVNTLGHDKIAVLYSDDEYGASMAENFKAALEKMDQQPAAYESYPRSDKDFSGQLTSVKKSEATCLYATGSYAASALIAKQAKQLGLSLQLIGDTGNATPKYIELGGEAVEGAVIVEPFTPADPDPAIQVFVEKYKSQYQQDPDGWVAEMYDTVGMIHEAVVKTGKIDPKSIQNYLAGLTSESAYSGILGDWYFGPEGNANFDLYKVQIKDGKKVILER